MALLLETNLGDLVIDLDIEGSPELCKNILKLAKARYYTSSLVYNVQPNRFCQLGDPFGDGSGGACIYGLIESEGSSKEVLKSGQRFLKSHMGRALTEEECKEKGRVVATEIKGIPNTIGSQLLITISEGQDMALDGYTSAVRDADMDGDRQLFRSVGVVREDENNVLDQIAATYCDPTGRPYADIRVLHALTVDDPFEDPPGMDRLYKTVGVEFDDDNKVTASPEYERPPDEIVEIRIPADQVDPLTTEEDVQKLRQREEELLQREDKGRAVVLEMLGDLPDAEVKAPEDVLFVCKLNPVTEDEDLELIFSRFDENVKAEIIRDPETGNSLQYAFVEFTKKEQAVEAYFKMNNALVDDRRIRVDFSQSVAKVWNKFSQRIKGQSGKKSNQHMPRNPFAGGATKPRHDSRNNERGRDFHDDGRRQRGPGGIQNNGRDNHHRHNHNHRHQEAPHRGGSEREQNDHHVDQFGRKRNWRAHRNANDDSRRQHEDAHRSRPSPDERNTGRDQSRRNDHRHHSDIEEERASRRRRHDSEDEGSKSHRGDRRRERRSRSLEDEGSPGRRDHGRRSRSRSHDNKNRKHQKHSRHHHSSRHRRNRSPDSSQDGERSKRRHRDGDDADRRRDKKRHKGSRKKHKSSRKEGGRDSSSERGHGDRRDRHHERKSGRDRHRRDRLSPHGSRGESESDDGRRRRHRRSGGNEARESRRRERDRSG